MTASTRRQLNIRSDEAYATAHELAEKLGVPTTEVVLNALREFKSKRSNPSRLVTIEESEANLAALEESLGRRPPTDAEPPLSDHGYLYDEFGLPKRWLSTLRR
jgi:hypothetical protein